MKYVIALFFVIVYKSLPAQVVGFVTDQESKEVLTGASIFLKSDWSRGTYADENGRFELKMPSVWKQDTLLVSYIGYEDQWIGIDQNQQVVLQIELSSKSQNVQEVVVKAKRMIAEEFAIKQMSKLDVYLNPNAKGDPLLAINSLPASTSNDETANISLRGSPASETGIYLNNVPIHDAVRLDQQNGVGQFSIFNTSMIQSLKVFPGNPPLEFPGATSGAVALYTRDRQIQNQSSVYLSLVGGGISGSRRIGKNTQLTGYLSQSFHQGLKSLNAKAMKSIHSFQSTDAGIYLLHRFNARSLLKIFNFGISEGYKYNFRHPSWEGLFTQQKKRNMTIANYSYQWDHARLEWNQGLNYSKAQYATGNIDNTIKDFDVFTGLNYHFFKGKWSVKSGVSLDNRSSKVKGAYPHYFYALAPEHPSSNFQSTERIGILESFIYGKYRVLPKLVFGAGLRMQPGLGDLEAYWSKQLNLSYELTDQQNLTASLGQYFKYLLPNEESDSKHIVESQQVTLDYQFKEDAWTAQAAIYYKKSTSLHLDNEIYGGELFLGFQDGVFSGSASIAHIHSMLKDGKTQYPSNYDLDYFLRLMVKYDIPGWMNWSLVYLQRQGAYFLPVIGSQLDNNTNTYQPFYAASAEGERLPTYRLVDLSVSKLMSVGEGALIVFLSANNIFDFKNVRGISYESDYSTSYENYFNRRSVFFGGVYSW